MRQLSVLVDLNRKWIFYLIIFTDVLVDSLINKLVVLAEVVCRLFIRRTPSVNGTIL